MENPGNLLANYGASPSVLQMNEDRQSRRINNRLNEYQLSSAIDENQRKNQLRALAPKALEGDKNALSQMAGVDPDTALRMRDALSKMSAEERDLAAQKTLGVMRVAQLADTPEKFAQTGLGLPWEQRGQLIARGAALKEGYDAIVAAEKEAYDRKFADKKLASEERRALKRSATASKPFKIGEDDMGQPIFGQWDQELGQIVPVDVGGSSKQQDAELTPAEIDRARVELSTAGGKDTGNDWIPFNEPSEDQIKARAWQNRNGGSQNILASSPTETNPQTADQAADPLLSQLQANRGKQPATASPAEKAITTNKLTGNRTSSTARPSQNPGRETAINQELNSIQSAMKALGDTVKQQGKMSPDIEAQIQQLNARQNALLSELKSIR